MVAQVDGLVEQLATRTAVGNAVGLLMGMLGTTRAEAIADLQRAADRAHRPPVEIAQLILEWFERRSTKDAPAG